MPYAVIGLTLLLLAALIGSSRLPRIETTPTRGGEKSNDTIWKHPSLTPAWEKPNWGR